MLLRPVDAAQGRLRADVEGEDVEPDRGPTRREDPPPLEVEPGRRGVDDPGVREAGELPEVDVRLFGEVVAGDEARQHPGVGGQQVARDQGEPHPRDRAHPEPLEHRHVAVAAADQHDVGGDGGGRAGHRAWARWHGRTRACSRVLGPQAAAQGRAAEREAVDGEVRQGKWRKRVGVEPTGHVARVPSDLKSVRPTGRRSSSPRPVAGGPPSRPAYPAGRDPADRDGG